MYFYEGNPILIAQFSCIVIGLLSVVGVIIVYLLGQGWKYFIANLFFTQIVCMLFFYVPQVLTPFIYYEQAKPDRLDCQLKTDQDNNTQSCINETYCELQGYLVNSSFLASTLISLYSCYIIKSTLNPNLKFVINTKQIYWIHFAIGFITFAICLPMLIGANFQHYGTSWKKQLIYYVCNLEVRSDDTFTRSLFWMQSSITTILLIVSLVFHFSVRSLKSKIRTNLTDEFDQCSSLNLYILPITLIILWTINMVEKLIDYQTDWIRNCGYFLQVLWFIPQLLLALQGFNYASLFFYAFHQQLVPNLPRSLKSTYMFFAKLSIYNLIFGKIKESKILKDSLLNDTDSARDSTSSYIQKDDSSTNR
ncbi:unnamed protein product (macronuclear) [Paramecium tetraurelia]|uniref:G-protein coupled receptors family 2 profile 2 domain-containing protein n=1 Tax=Paramecium tetraurelia TaxID=5888 RepID=A0DV55_PARTE|nr:uncharacterized protein GSPATT00020585001 [Paramecium tetraurelia]CAK86922.1 unnamed protein product [Paramecium tetraurelia]|eukprot:XP_001454319.1 hypothetical protein (macronuclear) [Paramecium tetraurelia strain d4-2]